MIEVQELAKAYGGNKGLDGFNLSIDEGELFGLVGPNGAGKTTLIKILATLLPPTSGSARINGFDVTENQQDVKRVVGYMPDQPGLYQEMRIREYLQFFADAFHIPHSQQAGRIDAALARSGLAERKESFVEELSFGWKQRLLLAKTLLHQPQVLLLDEPATGLDPTARLDLREQLRQLNAEGMTILISSHILADLEDICDRVAFISGGKNAADSDGHTVIELKKQDSALRVYEVAFLGGAEAAVKMLQSMPNVKVVRVEGSRCWLEVAGGDAEAAALLKVLVTSGIEVFKFDQRQGTLEESYQKVFGRKPS